MLLAKANPAPARVPAFTTTNTILLWSLRRSLLDYFLLFSLSLLSLLSVIFIFSCYYSSFVLTCCSYSYTKISLYLSLSSFQTQLFFFLCLFSLLLCFHWLFSFIRYIFVWLSCFSGHFTFSLFIFISVYFDYIQTPTHLHTHTHIQTNYIIMIGIRFGSSFIQFFRLRWPIDASLPLFISFHFTPLIMRFIHFNLREISDQTSNDRRPSILLHSLSSSAALRQTSNLGSIDQNYCQSPIVNRQSSIGQMLPLLYK